MGLIQNKEPLKGRNGRGRLQLLKIIKTRLILNKNKLKKSQKLQNK